MSEPKSLRQRESDIKRRNPRKRASGKAFLIVTEGEKTEIHYFEVLRKVLNLTKKDVVVHHPAGTDPMTLIESASKLSQDRKRLSKRQMDEVPFDEVWIVFDLERIGGVRRNQAQQAARSRKAQGMKFALSNPCFEYWMILHETYTHAPFDCCDSVIRKLKSHNPHYRKGVSPEVEYVARRLAAAVDRAIRCRKHHNAVGGDRNPSTDVDMLIRAINDALPEHRRHPLPAAEQDEAEQ